MSAQQARRHRRMTPVPPAVDLLDQIDAAVDAAGRGDPCGCGCGRDIPQDGPSEFFYDANCQAVWSNRQATNPVDVYAAPQREIPREQPDQEPTRLDWSLSNGGPITAVEEAIDLARMLMDASHYAQHGVPQLEITGFGPAVTQLLIDDPPPTRGTLVLRPGFWIADQNSPLPYRRRCRRCHEVATPVAAVRPPPIDVWSYLEYSPSVLLPEPVEACPRCRICHPGPRLSAQWRRTSDGGIELALMSPATGHGMRVRDDWLWGEEARLRVAYDLWSDMLRATMERLIFTHQCAVEGCGEIGRGRFRVNRPVSFLITSGVGPTENGRAQLQPGERWLCPRHQSSLFRAYDEVTLEPLLRRNLHAEQQEMSW